MKKYRLHLFVLFFILNCSFLTARPWRVLQIPNGSKFSCANCHVNPAGGGIRNKFGQDVEKLVTVGGNEDFWGAGLAKIDSDGDGKTNGQELGDPEGTWRPGQPNPGVFSAVTNAGDPASFTSVENNIALPLTYKLYDNYPNPFNPSTKIKFDLAAAAFAKLIVYDLLGNEIATLVNGELKPGSHEVEFNSSGLSSGIYFYTLKSDKYIMTKKMLLAK